MIRRLFGVRLVVLSLLHFATDALCISLIHGRLYPDDIGRAVLVFLLYNLAAFVLQAPLGLLIDRENRPWVMLLASGILLAAGYALGGVTLLSAILLGLGNAAFHVAGGKWVSEEGKNGISSLGIFVATGAVGLFIGERYACAPALTVALFAVFAFGILLLLLLPYAPPPDGEREDTPSAPRHGFLLFLAICAVVLMRALLGKVATAGFAMVGALPLLCTLATALGKMGGGILSRYIGIRWTVCLSMPTALVCLLLFDGIPALYILGVLAFNMSMPITLYYANRLLAGREGFAFGTLAAFLIPGYFLGLCLSREAAPYATFASALLSLLLLLLVWHALKKGAEK